MNATAIGVHELSCQLLDAAEHTPPMSPPPG